MASEKKGTSEKKGAYFKVNENEVKFGQTNAYAKTEKPDLLDEILHLLRKLLDYCLCCLTCGCYPGPRDNLTAEVYEAELMDEERQAVHNLLQYLHSGNNSLF